MKSYMHSLGSAKKREQFCRRVGMSVMSVNHFVYGSREPKHVEQFMAFIDASGGQLSLEGICPKLFGGAGGRARQRRLLEMLLAEQERREAA